METIHLPLSLNLQLLYHTVGPQCTSVTIDLMRIAVTRFETGMKVELLGRMFAQFVTETSRDASACALLFRPKNK